MTNHLLFTRVLNHAFADPVDGLLRAVHVSIENPRGPISDAFAMEFLVFLIMIGFFVMVRARLSVEAPGAFQHMAEMMHGQVLEETEPIIGHGFERFASYLTVLFVFILLGNLMGLVPGLESPTADVVVPLGLAIVTFIYYHYHGLRVHKHKYIKQFLGPVWWLAPLMFVIEVISHFARVLSLTVRLYANMFAGDLLTLAFFSLVPIGVPLLFLGLHLGVALVQAYVFFLLAAIYLSLAVSHDH